MNPETIIAYVQEQFDALRRSARGSLYQLSISVIGSRSTSAAVRFTAIVDSLQRGESEANLETAVARCIANGSPEEKLAAIERQIAELERQKRELEGKP